MSEPTIPVPPPAEPRPARTGRLLLGILLVLLGMAWLLEALGVVEVPWDLFVPLALIAVGAVLALNARTGASHPGLIALGVVLTVLSVLAAAVDLPVVGGVGERDFAPSTASTLERRYELGVGELTLDLTSLDASTIAAPTDVEARVGIGRLVVKVPSGLAVRVEARSGLGNVIVFGDEQGGIDVQVTHEPTEGSPVLVLEATVGIGEVSVDRG